MKLISWRSDQVQKSGVAALLLSRAVSTDLAVVN